MITAEFVYSIQHLDEGQGEHEVAEGTRRERGLAPETHVLMLTCKTDERDLVCLLEAYQAAADREAATRGAA